MSFFMCDLLERPRGMIARGDVRAKGHSVVTLLRFPQRGGEIGGAIELIAEGGGFKVVAELFELGDVVAEGVEDRAAIGGEDVAPDVEGAEGESGAVEQSWAEDARFWLRASAQHGCQGGGGELRQVRGEGDDAVVLGRVENDGDCADF